MGRLEELEAKYGVTAPAAAPRSRLEEMEAKYGIAPSTARPGKNLPEEIAKELSSSDPEVPNPPNWPSKEQLATANLDKVNEGLNPLRAELNKGIVERIGDTATAVGKAAAAAPGEALADPAGAVEEATKGWLRGRSFGLIDPTADIGTRRERLEHQRDTALMLAERGINPYARELARQDAARAQAELDNMKEHAFLSGAAEVVGAAKGGGALAAGKTARLLPEAEGLLARTSRAGIAAGVGGGVESGGRAIVAGKPLGEVAADTLEGAGHGYLGGAAGHLAITEAAGALAPRWAANADKRVIKDLRGEPQYGMADATHARRMAGNSAEEARPVIEFARRNPQLQAARKDPELRSNIAEKIIKDRAAQTAEIYPRFDQVAGEVPVSDVVRHLDDAIDQTLVPGGGFEGNGGRALRDALKDTRREVLDIATKEGRNSPVGATWTHKELRQWVTKRLKDATQSMGSLNETERAGVKNAIHDIADDFLKSRLAKTAEEFPDLADDYARLKPLNTDIAMAARIQQAADNAGGRQFWARESAGGSGRAALIAGLAFGSGGGLAGALGGAALAKGIPAASQGFDRNLALSLSGLARTIAEGGDTTAAAAGAIAAGAPRALVDKMLTKRQSSGSVPPDPGPPPWVPGMPVAGRMP